MKYIERYTSCNNRTIKLFGRAGVELSGEDQDKQPHFAKIIENPDSKNPISYYLRIHNGVLFDPMGPYSRRGRTLDTKMKRVSKNTFDFYMTYLKTNNSIYLTKAQRGFLND